MKKNLSYSILLIAIFFTAHLYGQIGTIIPYNRLPYEDGGATLAWTLAGYDGEIPYAEETIDVTQPPYNAAGDGVTDDTDAISRAIDDANPDLLTEILFPEGTYLIYGIPEQNQALALTSNIILKGVTAKDSDSNLSELKFLIGGDGHDPQANYIPHCIRISGTESDTIKNVGIEDLTIKRYNEVLNSQVANWLQDGTFIDKVKGINIYVDYAKNCWITGVESDHSLRYHIGVNRSNHIEITGCYIHDPQYTCGGGYGYGVSVCYSSYCLVENNIFSKCRHSMVLSGEASKNVFGYNYSTKARQTDNWFWGSSFTADICLHGNSENTGSSDLKPKNNLFEGNIVYMMKADDVHGSNGEYNTFFRNKGYEHGLWLENRWWEHLLHDTHNNHQIIVNNYVKCTHWFRSNFLGHPRRLEASTFFEKNTVVKKANLWGTSYRRVWSDDKQNKKYPDSWDNDVSYYREEKPDFMAHCSWPFHPEDDPYIPAKKRYAYGGKRTVSRDDVAEWFVTYHWRQDTTLVDNVVIPRYCGLVIEPGVTVRFDGNTRLIVRGSLIAQGTEMEPIVFTEKDAGEGWGGIEFVGTSADSTGTSILEYCTIEYVNVGPGTYDGTMKVESYNKIDITNCQFLSNSSFTCGGAMYVYSSDITVKNSIFYNNHTDGSGGAIYISQAPIYEYETNIIGNLFSANYAANKGGALYISGADDQLKVINNTFAKNIYDNDEHNGGGAVCNYNCDGSYYNNIFWENRELAKDTYYPGDEFYIESSDVYFFNNYIRALPYESPIYYDANLTKEDIDPEDIGFVDPDNQDFHLLADSPLINKGLFPASETDSLIVALYPATDMDGNCRVVLDTIDMGAYEVFEEGIYIEDTEIGFGDILQGDTARDTIVVKNKGTGDLTLYYDSFIIPEDFDVLCESTVISPHDSVFIFVDFIPTTLFKEYNDTLFIYSSDQYFPEVPVRLSGQKGPSEYQEVSGEINNDETWDGCIRITGNVTISNGATLTIAENSEVYNVEGHNLTLESGNITMDGANLYLDNSSEMHVYGGDVTLSGRSLLEVSGESVLKFYEGSGLYGTEHTIYVDPATGSRYETWAEAYEVNNEIGAEDAIPGDRVVVDNALFAMIGTQENPVTIASVGDGRWDGIEINNYSLWGSHISHGNISEIRHIQLNNSYLSLYNATYSNCGQISVNNNSFLFVEKSTIENINACPIYCCESSINAYDNTIQNNAGKGIYAYLPSSRSFVLENNIITSNDSWGVQFIDVPIYCFINNITNNSSHGFVSSGAEGTPVLAGNTIANNGGMEIVALYQWPDMVSYGGNTVYSQNNGGADHYLLATTVQGSDCRGNDIDISDHTRFSPSFDYYIFDGEEPEEKIPYAAAIEDISEEDYESAKITMTEVVNVYPATETASDALQWLLYLENFSGNDYAGLRSFAESIDDISHPNLERIKNKVITSTYMCEKDYLTSVDRLEDIIADPPSVEDSILAIIHEGYCYLKLEEEGDKAVPAECSFKPHSFNEFKYVSQNLLDDVLSALTFSVTNPQVEFALQQNYPNPAFRTTTFSFSIPANTKNAELKIYNIRGQLVKTFKSDTVKKGTDNKITWDCKDDNGRTLCNGIYFYKLKADKKETIKKMVIIR